MRSVVELRDVPGRTSARTRRSTEPWGSRSCQVHEALLVRDRIGKYTPPAKLTWLRTHPGSVDVTRVVSAPHSGISSVVRRRGDG
ncbi:MAG TPA: hypothetical protein RMH99_00670 [Sandaracinaceae bacterium LLY-WYZ-13_1]|nr:hypothetical protein [Sandaracinaceae bacterium LLY-WYZ-13_1]